MLRALAASGAAAQHVPAGAPLLLRADAAPLTVADPLPGETARYRVVAGGAEALAEGAKALAEGAALRLELPGAARTFGIRREARYRPGMQTATATALDASGEVAVVTRHRDRLVGFFTDGPDVLFLLPGDAPAFVRVPADALGELLCGAEGHGHPPGAPAHSRVHVPFAPALGAGDVPDEITVDVMIPYTPAAATWAQNDIRYGAIDVVIAQALGLSQLALDNSDARLRLRLVHSYRVDYDEATPDPGGTTASSAWHLRRLTASPVFNPFGPDAEGFMLEVHELRDLHGADLVALFALVSDVGGIAWRLNTLSGSPQYGFSVNRVQQMATGFTLVHEIGHNMGLGHGRDQPTNASGEAGGLFPYAVGWRWTGDNGVPYNSVMSYGRPGDTRAPVFSNPSVTWNGAPTGTSDPAVLYGPADAARALREIRYMVANYRLTLADPPVSSTVAPVSVTAAFGAETEAVVTVSNSGPSALMWDVDVRPDAPGGALRSAAASGALALAPPDEDAALTAALAARAYLPAGHDPLAGFSGKRLSDGPQTLFETSFEADEGFVPSASVRHGLWATPVSTPFSVLAANPAVGTQHLRITPPASGAQFVLSPFIGARPTGRYAVSAQVALGSLTGPAYFAIVREGLRGRIVAGWAFSGGNVFAYEPSTGSYTSANRSVSAGVYHRYEIVLDPDAALARYVVDGTEVATRSFAGGGPAQVQFIRNQGAGTDYLDVDDVAIRADYLGLSWLRLSTPYGVASPAGGTSPLRLRFPAEAAQTPGTRTARLFIRTSDPARPEQTVPVTYQVASVSAEEEAGVPALAVQPARPNPFRTEAAIGYALGAASHVVLEVFTVTGVRVATLVDALLPAGAHTATWAPEGLAAGVYVYRLRAGTHVHTGRLLLAR